MPCAAAGMPDLGLANVRGLETLGAACHIELHLVTFRQTLEALRGDRAEVDEDILAALLRDEAEALRIVEPLDSTVCHDSNLSFGGKPRLCCIPATEGAKEKRRANWILARRVSTKP